MEFNLKEKRARGQVTYIFKLKPEEEVKEILNKLKEEDLYSKLQIDLRFNAKQLNIGRVGIIRESQIERVKSEYPEKEQANFQSEIFGNISHDLYTYESVEKRNFEHI